MDGSGSEEPWSWASRVNSCLQTTFILLHLFSFFFSIFLPLWCKVFPPARPKANPAHLRWKRSGMLFSASRLRRYFNNSTCSAALMFQINRVLVLTVIPGTLGEGWMVLWTWRANLGHPPPVRGTQNQSEPLWREVMKVGRRPKHSWKNSAPQGSKKRRISVRSKNCFGINNPNWDWPARWMKVTQLSGRGAGFLQKKKKERTKRTGVWIRTQKVVSNWPKYKVVHFWPKWFKLSFFFLGWGWGGNCFQSVFIWWLTLKSK